MAILHRHFFLRLPQASWRAPTARRRRPNDKKGWGQHGRLLKPKDGLNGPPKAESDLSRRILIDHGTMVPSATVKAHRALKAHTFPALN